MPKTNAAKNRLADLVEEFVIGGKDKLAILEVIGDLGLVVDVKFSAIFGGGRYGKNNGFPIQ